MKLETKLEQLLPQWEAFEIHFHELIRGPEGGWSVNDSWTACKAECREHTIDALRSRWEIFKVNYLPKARVRDLTDIGDGNDGCFLEVDCTAFATLYSAKFSA